MTLPLVIDGAIGGGMCQIEGCAEHALGTLIWRHLPGMAGDGQADFCATHAAGVRRAAFIAYWQEFAKP